MPRKNLFASVLALLTGAKFLPHKRTGGFMLFMDKDMGGGSGGGSGGNAPTGTLEEQLTKAKSDLTAANGKVTSLTTELKTATDNAATLQQQFDSLQTTATATQSELVTTKAALTSEQGAHLATKSTLTTAQGNVARLESLCGLKGIDLTSVVPNEPRVEGNLTEAQWAQKVSSSTGAERAKILGEFKKAAQEGKVAKPAGK